MGKVCSQASPISSPLNVISTSWGNGLTKTSWSSKAKPWNCDRIPPCLTTGWGLTVGYQLWRKGCEDPGGQQTEDGTTKYTLPSNVKLGWRKGKEINFDIYIAYLFTADINALFRSLGSCADSRTSQRLFRTPVSVNFLEKTNSQTHK